MTALHTLPAGGWRRAVCIALVFGVMGAAAAPGVRLWQQTTAHDWRLLGLGALARVRLAAGADENALQRYEWTAGEPAPMPLWTVAADPKFDWTRERFLGLLGEARWRGLGAGSAIALAVLILFAGRRHYIYADGTERPRSPCGGSPAAPGTRAAKRSPARRIGTIPRCVVSRVLAAMPQREVRIAGIPYPKEARRGHTLVAGAAGSGRTVLISDLAGGIRAQGGRCIVLDRTGEYTRQLYDPDRDTILNPLEARAAGWSPLRDARGRGDFEAMAAALVPQPADGGEEVRTLAARQLFVESADALRRRSNAERGALLDLLFEASPEALARALEGTPSGTAVARIDPEILLPARAVLRHHLAALRFSRGKDFSIRDWVEHEDKGGLLFLASPDDPNGRLRGLVSAWTEIALDAVISLNPVRERRLWMVIDDVAALHRLPSLSAALAEARNAGVRFVVGIEALGPLRTHYGEDGAQTVSGLCATRVAMAAGDEATAAWCAARIGSESLAPAWRLRRLAPGQGVVRFPGRGDAAGFSLGNMRVRGTAARFVPVAGAWMFLEEAPTRPKAARTAPSPTGGRMTSETASPPTPADAERGGREDRERPEARPVRKRTYGRWV